MDLFLGTREREREPDLISFCFNIVLILVKAKCNPSCLCGCCWLGNDGELKMGPGGNLGLFYVAAVRLVKQSGY